MNSLRLLALTALLGFSCVMAVDNSDALETLLKSYETASPKVAATTYNYAQYPMYPAGVYPPFYQGVPSYGGVISGALLQNDLSNKNAFLSAQLDAASNHIDGIKQAHETHRQAHLTIVERLEADIVKGRDEQARLLVQIGSLNKTIHSITDYSTLKSKMVDHLVKLVVDFQKLNAKLYADIHELHSVLVVAENKHHSQIVDLQKVIAQASELLSGFASESAAEINKAELEAKNYKEDVAPAHSVRLLVDHYKTVEASKKLHEPSHDSVNYYEELLKQLEPLNA